MTTRCVPRFVSVARALDHYGVPDARARQMIEAAGRAPGAEITFETTPAGAANAGAVRVRITRMKGHHAEVSESPVDEGGTT